MNPSMNKTEEQIMLNLRQLYQSYGYRQYKVSKFEEYDLYLQNRNFLSSKQILTFHDTNGKLMALKPDITLSVIKNTQEGEGARKICYSENVYRVPKNGDGFKEIMQTGLEYVGEVDLYAMSEVVMLAARSLSAISPMYALDLSHMGVISGILETCGEEYAGDLLSLLGEKNRHGIAAYAEENGLDAKVSELLLSLLELSGPLDEVLPKVLQLPLPETSMEAVKELEALSGLLSVYGLCSLNLDFSVVNHMEYYSGITLRGFVDGVASSVLSGGRYDKLMAKMGKNTGAMGFAVYLDQLERFGKERALYDVDYLLEYDGESDLPTVIRTSRSLAEAGHSVRVQTQGAAPVKAAERLFIKGREVITLD